jgi:hypothetical protein
MPEEALQVTKQQFEHWELECARAREAGDEIRLAQCGRFLAQCKIVIAALERMANRRL